MANEKHIDEDEGKAKPKFQTEIQSAGPRRSSRAKRPSAKLKDLQEENKRKSTEITQTEVALRSSKDLKQHQALPQNSKKRYQTYLLFQLDSIFSP